MDDAEATGFDDYTAPSDPIATMRLAIERIKNDTGFFRPCHIIMHRDTIVAMAEHAARWIKRAEKFLRKPLLSGLYEKRQRQRKKGIASARLEQRRWYLAELPGMRRHEAEMRRVAGLDAKEADS